MLCAGEHAAITRRHGDTIQFLELQKDRSFNGYKRLGDLRYMGENSKIERNLSYRFHADDNVPLASGFGSYLIDAESLTKSGNFEMLLEMINTNAR